MTVDAADQMSGRLKMFSRDVLTHIGAMIGAFVLTTAAVAASVEPARTAVSAAQAMQVAAGDRLVA
ncbi:MAG: hypothetical protein JWN69_274 [Alphaproteobacteria bacterium]|nr:hypothetical protein [Alphaproteobacteria bacterium]